MWRPALLSVVVLWLLQTVHSRGFGAVSGVNTQGPVNNGYPQNGGGLPTKGVGQVMGAQQGYGGYPNKGQGYGAATGRTNGGNYNGYGAGAAPQGAAPMKGYGAGAGASNGQKRKPQGYNPLAGIRPGNAYQGGQNGYGAQNGQKAVRGPTNMHPHGAGPTGQAGAKPMKGYGRPYGAGPGMGVPAQAGYQGPAYGGNGYGAKNLGGYRPNAGPAAGTGPGLGSRFGNGMKGPKPGPGAGAGGANGHANKHGSRGPNVNGAVSNGYGYGMGGANKPKPGYGGNGYGANPNNGYNMNGARPMKPQPGYTNGAGVPAYGDQQKGHGSSGAGAKAGSKNNGERTNGAALGGYGNKLNGYGVPGQTPGAGNVGYGVGNGKSKPTGSLGGQGLKGGLLSAVQPAAQGGPMQGMVSPDQYQKPQGKVYSQEAQATLGPALVPQYNQDSVPTPGPVFMNAGGKNSKVSGAVAQPAATLPQVSGGMATKGQGAAQPDCGPMGAPNGQWMKIPRPEYGAFAGAGASPHTKGFGAGAGGYPNGGAKPIQNAGAYAGNGQNNGQNNGYGAGPGYPYAGKPGYGQGALPRAGAGDAGKSKSGYGNVAGVQPDYASLQGQGVPSVQGKSGAKPRPYTGEVPGGVDGMNRFQPQAAGYLPNPKMAGAYGGMGGFPFGAQNAKYGIGGLQFGGVPSNPGPNGAGKYGNGGGGSYGPSTGAKYGSTNGQQPLGGADNTQGYGRMPYEIQTAGQNPNAKSNAKYGSAFHPEPAAMGHGAKAPGQYSNLNGGQGQYVPQAFGAGGAAKSTGKYEAQTAYNPQPLETSALRPESAALPHDAFDSTSHKSYEKGEGPTAAAAVEGASMDRFDNVGYISGQVQPDAVAFPAASSPTSSVLYPSAAPYLPVDAAVTYGAATKGPVDSAPVTESQGAAQGLEQTDDVQQMPQQIQIQQQLKLHFHPQGGNDGKFDLNGFFGNGNGGLKG